MTEIPDTYQTKKTNHTKEIIKGGRGTMPAHRQPWRAGQVQPEEAVVLRNLILLAVLLAVVAVGAVCSFRTP